MAKTSRTSLALSLAMLAGCVAPREKVSEFKEEYSRMNVTELIMYLEERGLARTPTNEELENCRGSPNPIPNYQNQNLMRLAGRSIGRVPSRKY